MATAVDNPLRAGMHAVRTPEPCSVVIFGATGDLAHRKLVPSLYNLGADHLLPHGFALIGFARQEQEHDDFRTDMRQSVDTYSRLAPVEPQVWDSFAEGMYFQQADFGDSECYRQLAQLLEKVDRERGTEGNRVFYLAVPPTVIGLIAGKLREAGLITRNAFGERWTRIVVEKPFGRDLHSALSLNADLLKVFHEDQIYRIDHY
ncbi:MAG: glucose-6-phosphate dehydrogenase, partial [Chloroflexi bacterium]|nr:glucose-6-phosphate dehydrogenase [Chloroflexota bacterium]